MTIKNLTSTAAMASLCLIISSCGEKSTRKKNPAANPIVSQDQGVPGPITSPIYNQQSNPTQYQQSLPGGQSNCLPNSGKVPCSATNPYAGPAYDSKGGIGYPQNPYPGNGPQGGIGYPQNSYPGQREYIQNPGQNCPPGYYCNMGGGPQGGVISGGLSASFYSQQDVISCMGRAMERGIPVNGGWPIFDGGIQAGIIGNGGNLSYSIDGASNTNFPFPHVVMLKTVNILNAGTVYLNNPRAVYCIKQTNFISAMTYSACNPLGVIVYKNSGWLGLNALSIPGCGGF